MDFLLVLIELFSLGVTTDALRANISSKSAISLQRGPVDHKFRVEGVAPTNYYSSQKTRLNDLSYGMKICTDLSSVLSQFTRLMDGKTDRQTDRRTDSFLIARPRLRSMQRGKNVMGRVQVRPFWGEMTHVALLKSKGGNRLTFCIMWAQCSLLFK